MKEDPNVIFILRAISPYAQRWFQHSHNKTYYVPPPHVEIVAAASRESTPATNVGDEEEDADGLGDVYEDFSPQLRFIFDQKPKNIQAGYVFGSNPKTCDVLIGRSIDGISSSHFRITFDSQAQLVLIDSSMLGTAVSYGGRARNDKRNNPPDRKRNRPRDKSLDFTWILFPEIKNKTVVIGGAKRPSSSNVPRPIQRLKQRPIWIDLEEIGRGEYGIVYRAINVSTATIYAAKMFLRSGKEIREKWDREVAILQSVSHDHIVKFVDHDTEHKWPRLIMEYLPLGSLANQHRITEYETITLLYQGLSALNYLHTEEIVHRDLKPENILVQCRDTANFSIKIADFGMAKDGSFLKTVCGTRLYAAPEIWKGSPYTSKVDIWSLGVIAFKYARGLPNV
ncbi:Pkinase-domain-containing protein, partial [Patellaria atrata CBS 101060]